MDCPQYHFSVTPCCSTVSIRSWRFLLHPIVGGLPGDAGCDSPAVQPSAGTARSRQILVLEDEDLFDG